MYIQNFCSDFLDLVPGVISTKLKHNAPLSTNLPAEISGDVIVDTNKFDRAIFEHLLITRAPNYICANNVYRGTFSNGIFRFRLNLLKSSNTSKLHKIFRFIDTVSDAEGDCIASYVDRRISIACEHLLDAAIATARGDNSIAVLAINYARSQILGCLGVMAFRSVTAESIFVPFGPYRKVANSIIDAGTDAASFLSVLTAIESTFLLNDDFRSVSVSSEPSALHILRKLQPCQASINQPFSWYGIDSALIYDEVREIPITATKVIRAIVTHLSLQTCAEIGCGTGRLSIEISPVIQHLYAIDNSQAMLTNFRKKIRKNMCKNITPIFSSMGNTGLPDKSIDVVLEFEAFFLFPNPMRLSREIARILSPNGVVLRLMKTGGHDIHAKTIIQRFDETVAAHSSDGICFVGRKIDAKINACLKTQGIQTVCFELFTDQIEKTIDELLEARQRRAFPYLEDIPDSTLQAATATALATHTVDLVETWNTYYLFISVRESAINRIMEITQILEQLIFCTAHQVSLPLK
jgi:ubiquinone/menaquinone biosynthesis C-methylase UbiE